MAKSGILLIIILTLYLTLNLTFLTDHPPVWPDEAEYADVALNIKEEGRLYYRMGEKILANSDKVYWYPPFLFYLYGYLFKIFGFSIFVQRLPSLVAGLLFIILVFLFLKKYFNNNLLSIFLPLLLMLLDMTFERAARVSRPEMMILSLSFLAYLLILNYKNKLAYLLAGLVSGIAFLLQPFGIIAAVVITVFTFVSEGFRSIKKLAIFFLPILLFLGWWLYTIDFNLPALLAAMRLQVQRKALEPGYFVQLINSPDKIYLLLNLGLFFGFLFCLLYFLTHKKDQFGLFFVVALSVLYSAVIWGRQFWYFVYPIPFLYLSYAVIISNEVKPKKPKSSWLYFIYFFIAFNVLTNLKINYDIFRLFVGSSHSYYLFARSVAKKIPDRSTVLLSSIPDPYFELKKNKTLTLRHFVALPSLKAQYLAMLDTIDYIVYTAPLDLVYGNLLDSYIVANQQQLIKVDNGENQYRALIFKLKPKPERVKVSAP